MELRYPSIRYSANAETLRGILSTELQEHPVVFTHNPWGEYGHEEHIQVFVTVRGVSERIGIRTCTSGYFAVRSMRMMRKYASLLAPSPLVLPIDNQLVNEVH